MIDLVRWGGTSDIYLTEPEKTQALKGKLNEVVEAVNEIRGFLELRKPIPETGKGEYVFVPRGWEWVTWPGYDSDGNKVVAELHSESPAPPKSEAQELADEINRRLWGITEPSYARARADHIDFYLTEEEAKLDSEEYIIFGLPEARALLYGGESK